MNEFRKFVWTNLQTGEVSPGLDTKQLEGSGVATHSITEEQKQLSEFRIRGTNDEITRLKTVAGQLEISENETARLALALGLPLARIYVEWRSFVMEPVKNRMGRFGDDSIVSSFVTKDLFTQFAGDVEKLVSRISVRLQKAKEEADG